MKPEISQIWVYLSSTPLLWLTATLVAYAIADAISRACGRNPLANPVLIATCILAVALILTATPYETYFEGAQFVHFMLGPATVALAVPLYHNFGKVKRLVAPMACALAAGSVTAAASAVVILWALGAPPEIVASIAAKSATAPVAMELSKSLGGIPALTAVLVVITGVMGALIVTPLMNAMRIKNYAARGFAVGVASHGIGAARAFQVSELAGTFAGIAMGLNAAQTSIIVLVWLAFAG